MECNMLLFMVVIGGWRCFAQWVLEWIHMGIIILWFKLLLFITQFVTSAEFGKSINEIVFMTSTIQCLVQLAAIKSKRKFFECENCLHQIAYTAVFIYLFNGDICGCSIKSVNSISIETIYISFCFPIKFSNRNISIRF